MATRPDAPAADGPAGDDRPDERRRPTDAGDRCRSAPGRARAPRARTGRTSPRRRPTAPTSSIEATANARRIGSCADEPRPWRISRRTGSRSARFGGGGSGSPDAEQQDRRDDERDGVDEDRDRPGEELDEDAADPEADELGRRPARRQRAVGLDELVALDDRRQVGVVGRVEERGQDRRPGPRRRRAARGSARRATNATGIDTSRTARPRSAQIRTGRRRSRSTQAPATSPTSERRQRGRCSRRRATSIGPAPSDRMASERQRDPGDERPEDRDGRRRPQADEGAVLPERGGERVAHGPRSIRAGTRRARCTGPSRQARFRRPCATLRPPRCVRTRAPPGRSRARQPRRPVHPPDGVLTGPCSTPSASACARPSTP